MITQRNTDIALFCTNDMDVENLPTLLLACFYRVPQCSLYQGPVIIDSSLSDFRFAINA